MMKKNLSVLTVILVTGMVLTGIPTYADSLSPSGTESIQNMKPRRGRMGDGTGGIRPDENGMENEPMGNMGVFAGQEDSSIQSVLDENASKFEQFSYTDSELGITLEYSLYIPQEYDESTEYPLIMYIPDSTGAGLSAQEIVENYYGAAVWASDEDQEKHPSFVLVPAYTGTVTDDNWNASSQLDATVSLINHLVQEYSIDESRLYTTGQSMGCMSSLYLNSTYPDLFAASLYVSGQWDISVLSVLENQKFFYITAGGDEKASGGQDEVMAMFDQDGVPYSYGSWDAQEDNDTQNSNVVALTAEGLDANMIRFEAGTVLNGSGMEHMASFNYAYKLAAVRDWIFEQEK